MAPCSFPEIQTKPHTILGVMWSHGCPNWLVETDTKVFENIFPFSFFSQQSSFSKNLFLFANLTVRAKTHSEVFLKTSFLRKHFSKPFPFLPVPPSMVLQGF